MYLDAIKQAYPEAAGQLWFRVISTMSADTGAFMAVIVLFTLYFHARFTPEVIYKAPSFLTTLGILGTFLGIAVGLLSFDAAEVQRSVPALIDGVKTAVWASACGVFCALTIKLRDVFFTRRKAARKVVAATVDDLAESLRGIEQVLGGVEQALVGETEPSLLLQMKGAQAEQSAVMLKFGHALDHFCEQMADSNMRALVTALHEVIAQFNVRLDAQFGENFSRLHVATENMLRWQQHYAAEITRMAELQGEAARQMTAAGEQYRALLAQAEQFTQVADRMGTLLSGLETQRAQMQASLAALGGVLNAANAGLPQVERHIVEMTRQVMQGMQQANEEFNAQMRTLIEGTKAQVLTLDNALSEELSKSLESLGRQLASLSSKFAQDYGPITERLQQVLRIAG